MAIKPILFNTEMVRAILDGRKTCTRRLVKTRRKDACGLYVMKSPDGSFAGVYEYDEDGRMFENPLIPPYKPGDVLYVRETWCKGSWGNEKERYYYKSDDNDFLCTWHPSIHMPKEAARIWLKVTDIRAERLKEITEAQAKAEGIKRYSKDGNLYKYAVTDDWWIDYHNKHRKSFFGGTWWQDMPRTAKDAFSYLWDSTVKNSDLERYGWNANPWVWVIQFERCEKPEGVRR